MTIAAAFEQRGEERGNTKGKTDLVITMLKNGMPSEQIAKFTELDLVFIEQIKEQHHDIKH